MATVSGGDKLDAALARIAMQLRKGAVLRVGFLENAKYPDGTSVAMVAAIQDYGAPNANIPPRPFFRNMVADKSPEWPAAIAGLLPANDYDGQKVLKITGEAIKGQLRESIINTNTPPLAPSTLRKRGVAGMVYDKSDPKTFGAKPLIETAVMINSIDMEIET